MLPYLLRNNMPYKIYIILLIVIILASHVHCIAKEQASSPGHYPLELIKHYIGQEEFDLALTVAQDYSSEVERADSLAWLVASIYIYRNATEPAAKKYAEVIVISQDSKFKAAAMEKLKRLIPLLVPRRAIDLIIKTLEQVEDNQYYLKLILLLAELYENNYLYTEANDIYKSLLDGDFDIEQQELYIRIATNKVYQKKYAEAVSFAGKAEALQDSAHSSQALFIQFLSYQAQYKYKEALAPLMKLYLNFPEFGAIFDINMNLAELLVLQKEWLAAWYVLEKYYPQASALEKKMIIDEMINIKNSIPVDDENIRNFQFFRPDFNSLLENY